MQRVVRMLLFNIYPDCPTYRLENALELYKIVLNVCSQLVVLFIYFYFLFFLFYLFIYLFILYI
jgi:hypothetical protein